MSDWNWEERIVDSIDERLARLSDESAVDAATAEVLNDTRRVAIDHWGPQGAADPSTPGTCRCGQPRPCDTTRRLHAVYVDDQIPAHQYQALSCPAPGCAGKVNFDVGTANWSDTHLRASQGGSDHDEGCPYTLWLMDPATGRVLGFDEAPTTSSS